ncbi:MAG: sulfotransferase [Acidimicrobiia bacterium]|nr:sulfotransferase [Acidimicrobiia bacterium]
MTNAVDPLLAQASELTGGLANFGDDSFSDGLEVFLDSGANEGQLTEIGKAALEGMALSNLVNRLNVVEWHRTHPELATSNIDSPIFLIGLPRTGTTALSHLLSVDPANRSLLGWEISQSVPPPTTATYRTDPRFIAAMEAPDMLGMINPEFKAIHHDPPDMPLECATVLGQHFSSLHLSTTFNLPSYMDWIRTNDHTQAYEWHRTVLQVLQSQCPGQWQLKSPVHLIDPSAIATVYPDARFVLTHRDPVNVIASVCSLVRSLAGTFTDTDWQDYIRETWPEVVGSLLDNQNAFRDSQIAAGRGDSFVDIAYSDFVGDPITTIASLYEQLGENFSAEAESAMRAHSAEHKKDRFGSHSYSLEEWGLDRGALTERVQPYLTRYAEYLE